MSEHYEVMRGAGLPDKVIIDVTFTSPWLVNNDENVKVIYINRLIFNIDITLALMKYFPSKQILFCPPRSNKY